MNDKLIALEAAVAELRRELDELRRTRHRTMRDTHRCPACGGTPVLRFQRVKDVGYGELHDLSLHKERSFWRNVVTGGVLEAYACRACRLVEWHASSLDDVELGEDVTELFAEDPPREIGPYR
jgi:hypothetical protein